MTARTPAERQRLRRQRKRDGVRRILLDVPLSVVAMLKADGWLGDSEADDPERLGDVLSDFIECSAEGRLIQPHQRRERPN